MKTFHASFLFPLVLASLSYAPAFAGGRGCAAGSSPQSPPTIQTRVDSSVQEAIELASTGQPVGAKLKQVKDLVQLESLSYVGAAGECLIAKRLESEIAEIRARAERYLLHAFDVEAVQREIVLARLERAMVELKTRWGKGEKAEGVYQAAIAEMQSDALAWFEKHGMTTLRQRLQDAIFAAQQSAQNQIDLLHKQQAFFRIIYEARFTSAVSVLQEHIDAGTVSKLDYLRLEAVLRAFDTLMQTFWPYECTG